MNDSLKLKLAKPSKKLCLLWPKTLLLALMAIKSSSTEAHKLSTYDLASGCPTRDLTSALSKADMAKNLTFNAVYKKAKVFKDKLKNPCDFQPRDLVYWK